MKTINKLTILFVLLFVCAFSVYAADYGTPEGEGGFISDAVVSAIASQPYTGSAITPNVVVTYNGSTLVEGTDYTVTYTNNIKIGTAKVTIEGKGSYLGTKTVTFKILRNIASAKVYGVVTKTYTGSRQGQRLTVKYGTATLKAGTHYTASYTNNTNAGTATITITGKGIYAGTKKVTFRINRRSITGLTFSKVKNYYYTGKAISPNVRVKYGKIALVKNTDYTIDYTRNTNAGTATITITGKGNYYGTKKITFKINRRAISSATVTGLVGKNYTGGRQYQSLTLTYNGITLKNGTHYTLSYKNNINSGTATVTITGKGNFTGTKKLSFKIYKRNVSTLTITSTTATTYTGTARTPGVTVKYGTKTLKRNTDYTVSYKNNINIGTATITVTGKGQYTGTKTLTFEIKARDISTVTITGLTNRVYTGSRLGQSLKLTYGKMTLKAGTHYTLAYDNNTEVGIATVTITGKGNFAGSKTVTFNIVKRNVSSLTYNTVSNYVYSGKAITPAITVKYGSRTLVQDTDYTVAYKNNTNVGTATITITGIGSYTGTKTITFKINRRSIATATITGLVAKEYTGKNVTQALTLTYNGITLKAGTHYTIAYTNNKNVGKATVTITGKGNFTGAKALTFNITPQVPTMKSAVATDKNIKVTWNRVANATGYVLYMSKDGAAYSKVATITKNTTLTYTLTNLEDGHYTFKVRAYKTVSKVNYYSDYSSVVGAFVTYSTGPIDYIVGENITVGTYRVTPIDVSKPVTAYEYFDVSQFDDLDIPEEGGMGFAVYEISMSKGYITITEDDIGVTVTNGILEKIDLSNLTANIQTTVSNGMYMIGVDVAPGIYKVTTDEEYAAIELSDTARVSWDKEFMSSPVQSGYIEITDEYNFINVLNGTLTKVNEVPTNIKTKVSNGVFVVGKDIETGIYKVTKTAESYEIYYNIEMWSGLALEMFNSTDVAKGYIEISEDVYAINIINTTIEKVDEIPTDIKTKISDDGAYVVGKDLSTGVYKYAVKSGSEDMAVIFKLKDLKMNENSVTTSTYNSYGYFELTDEDYAINISGVTIEKVDYENIPVNLKTTLGEGVHLVGKDIAPGVYKLSYADIIADYEYGYVAKYGDGYLSMSYSSYVGAADIENEYLEVKDTDVAVVIEAGTLVKVDIDNLPVNIKTTINESGTYIVGKDIAPGTYKVTSLSGTYATVELLSALDGVYTSVISTNYLSGKVSYVEIPEGTYAINSDNAKLEKFSLEDATINLQTTITEEGVYLVGIDIAPGVYKLDEAYVTRYSSVNTTYTYMLGSASYTYGYIEIKDTDVAVEFDGESMTKVDVDKLPVNLQTTLTDGAYIVGKDIAPGTYKITADEGFESCLVETYSTINTSYADRTEYFLGNYGYIEVDAEDYLVVVNYGATITKVDLNNLEENIQTSVSGDGMYIVGKDIAPGVYKVESSDWNKENNINTHVTRYKSLDTSDSNVIYGYFAEYGYVEIKETDYMVKVQTGTITKVDLNNLEGNIQTSVSGDGIYVVGKDIAPGKYKVKNLVVTGYVHTLTSAVGEIVETTTVNSETYIEIKDTDVAISIYDVTLEKVEDTTTSQAAAKEGSVVEKQDSITEEINIYNEVNIYSEN